MKTVKSTDSQFGKWNLLNRDENDSIPEISDYSVLVEFSNGSIETIHVEDYFKEVGNGVDENYNPIKTRYYLSQFDNPLVAWMYLPISSKITSETYNTNTMEKSEIEVAKKWWNSFTYTNQHLIKSRTIGGNGKANTVSEISIINMFRIEVIIPFIKKRQYYLPNNIDYKLAFEDYSKEVLQNQPANVKLNHNEHINEKGYVVTDLTIDQPEPVNDDNVGDGGRESKIHIVKCWIQFKEDIISGKKKFEVRVNDRDYRVGDILIQQFWDNDLKRYVGGQVEQKIDYVLLGGQFGIEPNTVVMSVSSVSEPDLLGKLKKAEAALKEIELLCDNHNSEHENIWRIAYTYLNRLKHI